MKLRTLILLVAIAAFFSLRSEAANNGVYYQIPTAEYNALVDLYNQTGGSGWYNNSGWLDPDATSWYGVTVTGVQYDDSGNVTLPGNVISLSLDYNNTTGNNLIGTIPASLGNLSQLNSLDLGNNILSGSIPSTLGNLTKLDFLFLEFTKKLTGPIPPSLGNLANLEYLFLGDNQLSGPIPSSLGNIKKLQWLALWSNKLTGAIPSSLTNLANLQVCELNDNQLTGTIPATLDNLAYLQNLALGGNRLTGTIPATLGNLAYLQTLALDRNQLTGTIPASLGNLPNLQTLYLGQNQLTGEVPYFVGSSTVPLYMEVFYNYLDISPGSQSLTNIDMMIAARKTVEYTPQNGVSVTPLRVSAFTADVKATNYIDDPIVPVINPTYLSTASPLGMGVVADDVTPVLFQFKDTQFYATATNFTIQISNNTTSYNGSLSDHLFVLQNGAWTRTTNLIISSFNTPAYAYLSGLTWTDFSGTAADGVTVTVNVYLPGDSTPVGSTNFLVRPPPVVLVHGYNANASSWSPDFTNWLAVGGTPADFIRAINYGTDNDNLVNRTGSFDDLLPILDTALSAEESELHSDWAFTRYDVVGHSQGGVLLRMLCQNFPNRPAIVGPNNFYRGRFRRVITIGSPHNGSTLLHYVLDMQNSSDWLRSHIPAPFAALIQSKFDPFGSQIGKINSPIYPIDSRIKFHCIRTTVDDGLPPQSTINTPSEQYLGLCQLQFGGLSAGQYFLQNGYDGIVDFDSQRGGAGTPVTTMPNSVASPANIAHVAITWIGPLFQLFGVSSDHGQTTDENVAIQVGLLLSGPTNNFGPFVLPTPLPNSMKVVIDQVVPKPNIGGAIVALIHFNIPSTNYYYGLQTTPTLATNAPVTWFAQVFGTNGVSSTGISLLVNSNNTSQVMVSVTNGLLGTAVLYASYLDTNGNLVFANPLVVASYPPGTTLNGIELTPVSATMSVGDVLPTSIWGDYTNGTRSLLYVPGGQASYSSSNTNVATVSTNGTITLNSLGTATVTASCQGFMAQTIVSSAPTIIGNLYGSITTNGAYQLSLYSSTGTTNIVQTSTNLINWSVLATIYSTNGLIQFQDNAKMKMRFYRVQQQ